LLVVAAFSRHPAALDWAAGRLVEEFGPVGLASAEFDFEQTAYYEATMGPGLRKRLIAFQELVEPDGLPVTKRRCLALEAECAATAAYLEPRPLNLDPGFLSAEKLILATTKDQAHRIYLRDGIFAEVTLRYADGRFVAWPWTYADYQLPLVLDFLKKARTYYRQRQRAAGDQSRTNQPSPPPRLP
jgi:hypothetical protein